MLNKKLRPTIKLPGLKIVLPAEASFETIARAKRLGLENLARMRMNKKRQKARIAAEKERGRISARKETNPGYGLGKPKTAAGKIQKELTRLLAGSGSATIKIGKQNFVITVSEGNKLHIHRGKKSIENEVTDLETRLNVLKEAGKMLK